MPVSPKIFSNVSAEKISNEITLIDAKLYEKAENRLHENEKVEVIFGDRGLNLAERAFIKEEYERAGWKEVKSLTSAENGERAGLISWTFYF